MNVVWVANPRFEEEVQQSDDLQSAVMEAAQAAADAAKGIVPVDTGALRDSIQAVEDKQGENAGATVEATAPYAMFVEFGTQDHSAQPFLRPAVDSVGLRRGGA